MRTRALGDDLEVAAIGLGCTGMVWAYGAAPGDRDEAIATIHLALERGVTMLDTADAYGPHTNEELVGEAIRAAAVHPIAAVQGEYSLWSREIEHVALPAMRELGVGLVAYAPLGRGFLSGTIRSPDDLAADDWRRTAPRFARENFDHNLQLVRVIERLASSKGVTPAQLAIAWVLAQGPDVVPIPGTRRRSRLEENLSAEDILLSAADLARIAQAMPAAAGDRY